MAEMGLISSFSLKHMFEEILVFLELFSETFALSRLGKTVILMKVSTLSNTIECDMERNSVLKWTQSKQAQIRFLGFWEKELNSVSQIDPRSPFHFCIVLQNLFSKPYLWASLGKKFYFRKVF